MRKIGVLGLVLVLALAALVVGYAYWTETLTIDGTVTTGELEMDWLNNPWNHPKTSAKTPHVTHTWSVNGQTLTVTFGNLYPGAVIHWQGWAWNSGSIPAKFKEVNINVTSDSKGVANYLYVVPTNTYVSWNPDGDGPMPAPSAHSPVWGGYTNFKFVDLDEAINGVAVTGFPHLYAVPKFVLYPTTVPGDWKYAGRFALGNVDVDDEEAECIQLKLDPNAPNGIEGATFQFTMEVVFTQHNIP